jgi:hypothetical protein
MIDDARVRGGHAGRASEDHAEEIAGPSQAPSYDVITEAMCGAWEEALRLLGGPPENPLPLWMMLATRILVAAGDGERDPGCLKRIALRGSRAS